MADIEGLRSHAVIDASVSNDEVRAYLEAAEGYLELADVIGPSSDERALRPAAARLYDLAVYMIGTYYYERRGMLGDPPTADAMGVQGIIHQLRDVFEGEE